MLPRDGGTREGGRGGGEQRATGNSSIYIYLLLCFYLATKVMFPPGPHPPMCFMRVVSCTSVRSPLTTDGATATATATANDSNNTHSGKSGRGFDVPERGNIVSMMMMMMTMWIMMLMRTLIVTLLIHVGASQRMHRSMDTVSTSNVTTSVQVQFSNC
mmetsp:Transcript_42541/g.47567  ORF Transcript_42541/g.47567 Transcript_42541/m.47567 type:complete len:158 (+) Transcript_42541:159-632(+)